ncbi:MAG: alpha/beta hydrolase-fold protein [Bacteroidota bacterium]
MRTKYILKIILFIYVISNVSVFAQTKSEKKKYSEIIPNHTELKIIHSNIIDDDYFLYIKLPSGYKDSDKNYPVIYLLDGDIAFTMAWSTVRYLQYGKHLSDVIIVGIGYGSLLSSDERNMRERDYSISALQRLEESGGGEKFLKFIKTELIQFIDSHYRTKPNERIINGYSIGGLFTLYVFLNENDLFSGYIAGSPYTPFDKDYLLEILQQNSEKLRNTDTKLFISYGELEDKEEYVIPIEDVVNKLYDSGINKNRIKKQIFNNGSHFTCPSEAMVYGLKFIFE